MKKWTADDIPSQIGRSVVVTGTGGLGFECALALARAGAEVIVAGRNAARGTEAVSRIDRTVANAKVAFESLDLASLASIRTFADRMQVKRTSIDVLINNAGVMVPPSRLETTDGFELQMGTNYLGHFALTAHLLPLLRKGKEPRVVTLSSVAARSGSIDFDDLNATTKYRPMSVYSQSKLACLLFSFEFQRRSEGFGWGISSIAAHPGVSRTNLLHNAPGRWSSVGMARTFLWFLFQPASQGALPALFAATSPDAHGGGYYGPNRLNEVRGYPALSTIPPQASDPSTARRLWLESEELTRVKFG